MASKSFLLFGFLLVALMILSEVAARELAATSHAHIDAKGIVDAKHGGYPGGGGYPGQGGGYPGGGYPGGGYPGGGYPGGGYPGRGGYPGGGYPGGGHGGGYCRYGCCRRDYRNYCLRCCGHASEANHAQVETKPQN